MHLLDFTPGHDALISVYQSHGPMPGSGWVSGSDGVRRPLGVGRGAFIGRGEVHAKGSESGLTAIMVQLTDLAAAPIARAV